MRGRMGRVNGIHHLVSLVYVSMLQNKLPHCSYVQAVMRMPSDNEEQLPLFRANVHLRQQKMVGIGICCLVHIRCSR